MDNIKIHIDGEFHQINLHGENKIEIIGKIVGQTDNKDGDIHRKRFWERIFSCSSNKIIIDNIELQVDGKVYQANLKGKNKIKIIGNFTADRKVDEKKNKVWYKFKDNIFLYVIGITILVSAILFFLSPKIQENYVGSILAFVGILATVIVINNYMQVREIENKIENKIEETKKELTDIIEKKNHDNILRNFAIILQQEAKIERDSENYICALRCYIRALNCINHLYEKIRSDGIIEDIRFIQVCIGMKSIKISHKECNMFIKVLENSYNQSNKYLIDEIIINMKAEIDENSE